MRVCPRCEAAIDESGTFCPDCGTSFSLAAMSVTAESAIKTLPRASAVASQALPGGAAPPHGGAELIDPTAATGAIEVAPPTLAPTPVAAAGSNLVGFTIDNQFTVEAELGGGAFGTVYRGRQLGLDRIVAIKVPTHEIAADPVMAKRFAREARSAAKIQHPGVVAIHAAGELADGRPYLVMQFVEGEPLHHILDAGALLPTRALRIIRAIASALSETHAAGVVHRDLKPSNIMWHRDRHGDDRLTIVDFGIAASKPGTADASRLTANGLIGTPHYMSPEQAHGETVDARADLYALGCLLFELVTGATPFEGSAFEVLLAHLGKAAPIPSERNKNVPEVIDGLCAHLLAKKPEDRPQTADEVVTLVDVALAELATGEGSLDRTARKPLPKRKRRPTAATRPDLPDDYLAEVAGTTEPPRPRGWLRFGLGAAAGLAVAFAAMLALGRGHLPGAALDDSGDDDTAAQPDLGSADKTRQIDLDDGEVVMHLQLPETIVAKRATRARIEIKNKLGQPIVTKELVVTIADDSGPTGLVAHPRRNGPGYGFRYTFPHAGRYTLKVFPPSVASAFEIDLDVR